MTKQYDLEEHWIRMLAKCYPENKNDLKKLWVESTELTLIFGKIVRTLNKKL